MNIVMKPLHDLHPYENNPRNNDAAVEYVANSIQSFGFKVPIILDRNDIIVCGHTRYEAAKKVGLSDVPCIYANDLDDEQIKAFRLADNKVSEIATWDDDLLSLELQDLTIDMGDFGFDIPDILAAMDDDEEPEAKGNERERTMNGYNLDDYDSERTDGFYQMPIIYRVDCTPESLIGFNYMKSTPPSKGVGVHFFIDDYQFERIWANPYEYASELATYDCVLTPDFSLYSEMPMAMKIWNVYRSRLVGQILQDIGATVIPTVSWAEPETFTFCFDGIEAGGTIAVSTIGVKREDMRMKLWTDGMGAALKRIRPSHVIVYGGDIGYEFPCKVTHIGNAVTERMKERGR